MKNSAFLLGLVLMLLAPIAEAQINSPYSRIGIGNLYNPGSTAGKGIGITAVQSQNGTGIDYGNPATYALFGRSHLKMFRNTKLQGAFNANFLQIQDENRDVTSGNGSLGELAMGFPMGQKAGLAFGLTPISHVQYGIEENIADTGDLTQSNTYEGGGNTYRFFLGTGYEWKGLAFGANLNYMFGRTTNTKSVEFPDLDNSLGARSETLLKPAGLYYDAGVHYRYNLKQNFESLTRAGDSLFTPDLELAAGFSFQTEQNISVTREQDFYQYIPATGSNFDTISQNNSRFDMNLPLRWTAGLALSKRRKWTVGMEYTFSNWEKFTGFQGTDTLANSNKFSLGFEIALDSTKGYFDENKKIRLGIHYGKSHLILKDRHFEDFGMTFGFAIPITRYVTTREGKIPLYNYLDFTLDVGQRGTIEDKLIKENYFNATLGLTFNYGWFKRVRYD